MRAARHAGMKPETTPVTNETNNASPITGSDMDIEITSCEITSVATYVRISPTNPPSTQIEAASIRNCSRMVRRFAPMALAMTNRNCSWLIWPSSAPLMKSLRRLQIDPLAVYGTLFVKCPVADTSLADPACLARVAEEIAIVAPKIIVAMGDDALYALDELMLPLAVPLEPQLGEIQQLTPQIAALHVPNIDEALDDERSKRAFWAAFRVLGDWYAELPPW